VGLFDVAQSQLLLVTQTAVWAQKVRALEHDFSSLDEDRIDRVKNHLNAAGSAPGHAWLGLCRCPIAHSLPLPLVEHESDAP
jgi:hypothetical protein